MKTTKKIQRNTIGKLALIFVAALSLILTACPNGNDGGGEIEEGDELTGSISIEPEGIVPVNTELVAVYTGSEEISYQWKKDNNSISGATGETYTPTTAGDYKVTIKADGFKIKDSNVVTVAAAGAAIPLTAGKWAHGVIGATASVTYSLSVTQGSMYYIWWNEKSPNGDGTQTGNIKVSATNTDGTKLIFSAGPMETEWGFTNTETAWSSGVTLVAMETKTIHLKVEPSDNTSAGTFAIVYNTANEKPIDFPSVMTPLNANEWSDSHIAESTIFHWYSFDVTANTTYNMWWNETGANGNGTKTGNVRVIAYYDDGTIAFLSQETAWATAASFTPVGFSGKAYVQVSIAANTNAGSYAIAYSTNATRPLTPVDATLLTANTWADGEIKDADGVDWYKFNVTAGNTYYVWWNETGTNGDLTKTGDVTVSAWDSDWTPITSFADVATAWETVKTIAIPAGSTATEVYLRVKPSSGTTLGTYGILYNTTGTRPLSKEYTDAIPLSNNMWKDDTITVAGGTKWYKFDVSSGTYRLWWNETGADGDGTKTANIKVSARYTNGSAVSTFTNIDTAWATAQSFTASSNNTVYLKVEAATAGTYAIVYSSDAGGNTSDYRPPILPPANVTQLVNNTWKDGTLAANGTDWYAITVTANTPCYMWWDLSGTGTGIKTASTIYVNAWQSDGTKLMNNQTNAWGTSQSFTPTAAGTVYVRVTTGSTGAGTYGIVYSTTNSRPSPFASIDATAVVIRNDVAVWAPMGTITNADDEKWYKVTLRSTSSYLWVDDKVWGVATGWVRASAWYQDGTPVQNFTNIAGQLNAINITGSGATNGAVVYIRVKANTTDHPTDFAGTFRLAYSTENNKGTILTDPNNP